jgi:hypothetical protein
MTEAILFHSWKGHCVETIRAIDIKSRAATLDLGGLVDSQMRPVYWVGWGVRGTGRKIRPYFKHWPKEGKGRRIFPSFKDTVAARDVIRKESSLHRKAKKICVEALSELVQSKKELLWYFKNDKISDFPMTGNLLANVTEINEEVSVETPFGENYRFDVALLATGAPFKKPVLLGAVEFEYQSKLTMWKTAICKAMGFPIISIDLDEVKEEEITKEWVAKILTETTKTNENGQRRNYFFVHSMLYPVYLEIPQNISRRHQYVVFAENKILFKIRDWLDELRKRLNLSEQQIRLQPNSATSPQAQKAMKHEGSMAGYDWAEYNTEKYLRISLDVPGKAGPNYLFHMALSRLLCWSDCLVGYKYEMGVTNRNPDDPLWTHTPWEGELQKEKIKVAPKHLSQPLRPLLKFLEAVEKDKLDDSGSIDFTILP